MSSTLLYFSLEKLFVCYIICFVKEKYLKASEVADKFGVKHVTVRAWLNRGLFPNAKLEETIAGSIWLIPESDLKNFKKPEMGRPPKNKN